MLVIALCFCDESQHETIIDYLLKVHFHMCPSAILKIALKTKYNFFVFPS